MNAVSWIAVWGVVALGAAVAAGVIAAAKNRDHSWWAAWSFVLPPMLIVLLLMPKNAGPRPRRPSLDDEDREREAV
jgi:hypothetical protein